MPPPLNLLRPARAIAFRPKPQVQWRLRPSMRTTPSQFRFYSSPSGPATPPAADRSKQPDAKPLDHVSEEAQKTAEIMGRAGPEPAKQGTPIAKVVEGDKEAQEKLPKVMQDSINAKASSAPKGSRSYSTSTTPTSEGEMDLGLVNMDPSTMAAAEVPGVKFGMPTLPLPKDGHVKHRYDDVVEQVTNLLMRHGEKSKAQRNMAFILQHLRTSPIPTINPARPLLPGAPPPSHLPLNPILYLTLAIDSVAPLIRIRSQRGAAGGGVALQIPVPLGQRQRRRTAVEWILNAAGRRRNAGSGKDGFAKKVAEELVSVVEGRSGVWDRRGGVHKLGVAARANIVLPRKR
ncbi:30S ribosomal protein-like protein S7 [Amniculicola lignicola CBS 123094]|uniref:Small ribosomal subunit protein uS7m n=1 Tax=Amniculicola lignicola CBS 123094 TaxID=1392246 RepID=A0A6A5X125_9PLEO|nr:30S ribosomal protein-like protein S7 [Amniculicola lignicola CBS 123094]